MQIVYNHIRDIEVAPRPLQATDTPLVISRIPEFEVVRLRELAVYDECLMTHEHPILETFQGECLRCGQMARGDKSTLAVDKIGLPVHYARIVVVDYLSCKQFKCVRRVKRVASIKKYELVALCRVHGLVHGVVYPFVGTRIYARLRDARVYCEFKCAVGRYAVHYDVLEEGAGLFLDALQCCRECGGGVVCYGYY